MKKEVGLWLDHRQAVIVGVADDGEEIRCITSNIEKHVRHSSGSGSQNGSAEDQRDRQFDGHLDKYYDAIITGIRDAESILIFGPGEAKGELEKRLDGAGLGERIVGVESADKMTDAQITARVIQHFHKESQRGRGLRAREVHHG
ncbi:MAG: hypothetical protein HZB53_19770 [Chloroflexi bacterium]|nr:hypothetical protein [Chloroflexota bacterium]